MNKLHEQYVQMIAHVVSRSNQDRSLFISALETVIPEKVIVPQIVFINIKFTLSKIYDSYFLVSGENESPNFIDL